MKADIEIRRTDAVPADELEAIRRWQAQIFGNSEYQWADSDWLLTVKVDGNFVSGLEVVERTAKVGNRDVRLGGVGGVITLPEWRGKGLASAALQRANDFICGELGAEFGLLVTGEALIPFYSRVGWERVNGPLTFDQPDGRKVTVTDWVIMVLRCNGRKWPGGEIDLCGLPW